MSDVKKRPSGSSSRAERAAATRRRILDAARRLLSEQGYAGTTMQAIADGAGVAVQTVYFVFHTKGELLRQLLKSMGGRPGDPAETMKRDWVTDAMTDADGRRTVALMVEHGNDIYARVAPVWAAIAQAATVEPEVAEVLDGIVEQRREGIRQVVDSLAARGQLRDGLSVDRAADIVYGVHRPETYAVFVGECGWSDSAFKAWSYQLLCDQLLSGGVASAQRPRPTRGLSFDTARS